MEPIIIRTLHHLPCTGGTVISKCIASMPDTVLLSEVHPRSKKRIFFNPMDPLQQFYAQYNGMDGAALKKAFLQRLAPVVDSCTRDNNSLILRDHAASDFMTARPDLEMTLRCTLEEQFSLIGAVTIRHPLDAYTSMYKKNWHRGLDFNQYCERFLQLIDYYGDFPVHKYEVFAKHPDTFLQNLCSDLKIRFEPGYEERFSNWKLSGDSGRRSDKIRPRPRRETARDFYDEARNSSAFARIGELFGYDLESHESESVLISD